MSEGFSALILAGSRGGVDPVAGYASVSHKALIVLDGETLLGRVAQALRDAGATRIAVSVSDDAVRAEATALGLTVLTAANGPSLSVREGIAALGTPLMVTTADHALLHPDWIRRFRADAPPRTLPQTSWPRRSPRQPHRRHWRCAPRPMPTVGRTVSRWWCRTT